MLSELPVSRIRELARAEAMRRGLLDDSVNPQCPEWAHDDQRAWYDSEVTTCVGLAGTQGGKTAMLPHLLLKRAKDAAPLVRDLRRGDMLYIGPTLELLSAQAIPAFQRLWQEELGLGRMVFGGRPKFVLDKDGARRLWGVSVPGIVRCAYANDSSNLESLTAIAAAWDEAGQKENREESYHAVLRRLAIARSFGFGRLDIGTTPYDWGWLKRIVVDLADDERIKVFNWPSWANPLFDRAIAEEHAKSYPEWRWQMMYLGMYTKPAGLVYDCWDTKTHIYRDGLPIPEEWPRYIGLDFGPDNTAAVLIAGERKPLPNGRWGDMTGRFYAYKEYHDGQKTAEEHIECITEGYSGLFYAVGGNKTGEQGWRGFYSLAGLPVHEPRERLVEVGIQYVYRLLKTGRLFVSKDCPKLINDLSTYSYDIDESGESTGKLNPATKAKFHHADALRYISQTLYETAVIDDPEPVKPGTFAYYDALDEYHANRKEPEAENRWSTAFDDD